MGWIPCALALVVEETSGAYMVDRWGVEDGLPGAQILSINQTSDGYIWVGTYYGLTRFDGLGFTVFDAQTEGLPSGPTFDLLAGHDGDLWILKQRKLVHYSNGIFQTHHDFNEDVQVTTASLLDFVGLAQDGAPLIGLRNQKIKSIRISSFQQGLLKTVFKQTFDKGRILRPCLDSSDRIWFGLGQQPGVVSDGVWQPSLDFPKKGNGPVRVTPSKSGGLWGISNQDIFRFQDGKWNTFKIGGVTNADAPFRSLTENLDGSIWVRTSDNRVTQYFQKGRGQLVRGEFIENVPRGYLMFDFDGGLWAAPPLADFSLVRYRRRTFWNLNHIPETQGVVRCFAQRKNGDMMLNVTSGLLRLPADKLKKFPQLNFEAETFQGPQAWTMLMDSQDRLLAGKKNMGNLSYRTTLKEGALVYVDSDDRIYELFPEEIGMEYRISALGEGKKGQIWIGTESSVLFEINENKLTRFGPDNGFDFGVIHALTPDLNGGVWIGTARDGLIHFLNGKISRHLDQLQIRTVVMDDEGTLWIGTSGSGIFRYRDGSFFQFNRSHGLPVNDANTIVDDGVGNMWFGSYRGIHRIRKHNFEMVSSGKSHDLLPNSFTLADGLSSMQCPTGHPAGFRAQDGKLWFATVNGVNVVDPKMVPVRQKVYSPIIEHVLLDGQRAESEGGLGAIIVEPGVSRVEFRYTAISLDAPKEIRFRYRLAGHDLQWVDAGRQRTATYSQLDAGDYVFEVMAIDSDGEWGSKKSQVPILVRGPIWESVSFQLSVLFFMILVSGGLVYSRSRRQSQRLAARNRFTKDVIDNQEADRRRIARELHDSLEQNLLVIKNQAVLSSRSQGIDSKLKGQLEEISEISSGSIEEVRLIANNLRPYQIDRLGLTKAIESMLNQVSESSGLEIQRLIDKVPDTVSSDLQMNIYRIIQEVLNNTLKHAKASKALLTLVIGEKDLSLQIKDNGIGFKVGDDKDLKRIEGYGLRGIEERVDLFGGRCELRSSPGSGTEWDIKIPFG